MDTDLSALAQIAVEREGGEAERHRAEFERFLRDASAGEALLLVGVAGEEIVGFGKAARFHHGVAAEAPDLAPEGWYLVGVVVKPEWRRRGIGDRLTKERIRWIAERTSKVYYFVNARNLVSIDLHRPHGFLEITRRFTFPGASFVGGEGVLFGLDLEQRK